MHIQSNRAPVLLMGIFVLCSCHKYISVDAVKVTRADVQSTVMSIASGAIEAEHDSWLGFSATGRVGKVLVQQGQKVVEGQRLAELENTDLAFIFEDAQSEMQRNIKLQQEGLVSRASLDQSRKAFEVARANLERTIIVAPFPGMVIDLKLKVGEQVPSGERQGMRLTDIRARLVRGQIDELDLSKVKPNQPALVRVLAARPKPFPAQVMKVIPYIEGTKEHRRSSEVVLRLQPTDQTVPVGASAEIEIVVGSKKNTLAIPSRAVLGSGDLRYVLRADTETLTRAPIKVGAQSSDRAEILEGLKEGDVVALPPIGGQLQEGQKVKTTIL